MNLAPLPIQKFFSNNGRPLDGGQLFTYASGTSTKIATSKDAAGTPNTNPIVLDFRGECRLWIDPQLAYTFVLAPANDTDPPTNPIWTVNDITAAPQAFDNAAVDTGSVNNIALAIPQISAPTAFTRIVFQAAHTNTDSVTISINGGTAKDLTWQNIGVFRGGEIQQGGIYQAVYDGAQWQLQGPALGVPEQRTAAEISAGVTPLNYAYLPGDLRRYGADVSGVADSTNSINAALSAAVEPGGTGYVYHPGGVIAHASTISVPNEVRIFGDDNSTCEFLYTGTNDGWQNINGPNSSGFALVYFDRLKLNTNNNANTGAAIELNAGGFSYYGVTNCWITGKWKYGVILDAVEITNVGTNIFDISGPANQISIWIVNGSDRVGAQTAGFSNGIWITKNQISQNGGIGLADDGGNCHWMNGNLFNQCSVSARLAKVTDSQFCNNSMESTLQTGTENVLFATTGAVSGAAKGACFTVDVHNNTFSQNMNTGGACLRFAGTAFHYAIDVRCCNFVDLFGRGHAIDLLKLGNSFCGYNHDDGSGAMTHYENEHNDADGNTLLPPQNGFSVALGITAPVYGDTRYKQIFPGGLDALSGSAGGLQIDAQKWQNFCIVIINTAGTLQHKIVDQFQSGAACAYVDKITGASTSLANLPTNLDSTHGFTNGAGLFAGSNHLLLFDSAAAQDTTKSNFAARIVYYDGNNTRCLVDWRPVSRNINGVTRVRPEVNVVNDLTGANVAIDTTLLPAGKSIAIQISGYFA